MNTFLQIMDLPDLPRLATDKIFTALHLFEQFKVRRVSRGWKETVEGYLRVTPVYNFNLFGELYLTLPW